MYCHDGLITTGKGMLCIFDTFTLANKAHFIRYDGSKTP
jgi:hypothetical protein